MTQLETIRLFATPPHECSYLAGEDATTIFIDPATGIDQALYSALSEQGFRRSGAHIYRPHCENCQACVAARIPVAAFKPNRQQKRCLKRNSDLSLSTIDSIDSDEHYGLYQNYINSRHRDGDMYPPSREQYDSFLTSEWGLTLFIEFRLEQRLLGVAVCDRLDNGLSAVYTFFDPAEKQRSLGAFAILSQIRVTQQAGQDYLYLGYWIKGCQKMDYKTQYRPLELLVNQQWRHLN